MKVFIIPSNKLEKEVKQSTRIFLCSGCIICGYSLLIILQKATTTDCVIWVSVMADNNSNSNCSLGFFSAKRFLQLLCYCRPLLLKERKKKFIVNIPRVKLNEKKAEWETIRKEEEAHAVILHASCFILALVSLKEMI